MIEMTTPTPSRALAISTEYLQAVQALHGALLWGDGAIPTEPRPTLMRRVLLYPVQKSPWRRSRQSCVIIFPHPSLGRSSGEKVAQRAVQIKYTRVCVRCNHEKLRYQRTYDIYCSGYT